MIKEQDREPSLLQSIGLSVVAGVVATSMMTVTMFTLRSLLESEHKRPIPPKRVVGGLAHKAGLDKEMTEKEWELATYVAHYGYGISQAVVFALLTRKRSSHLVAKGVAFGSALWIGNYMGWLPLLDILRPQWQEPPSRITLNGVSHVVFGATTAGTLRLLSDRAA